MMSIQGEKLFLHPTTLPSPPTPPLGKKAFVKERGGVQPIRGEPDQCLFHKPGNRRAFKLACVIGWKPLLGNAWLLSAIERYA